MEYRAGSITGGGAENESDAGRCDWAWTMERYSSARQARVAGERSQCDFDDSLLRAVGVHASRGVVGQRIGEMERPRLDRFRSRADRYSQIVREGGGVGEEARAAGVLGRVRGISGGRYGIAGALDAIRGAGSGAAGL